MYTTTVDLESNPVESESSGMSPRINKTTPPPPLDLAGKRVYFIGIGGSGMSGLARLMRARGAVVTGSDVSPSEATTALIADRFNLGFDQTAETLPAACDLVVASAAIKADHPQLAAAHRRKIPALCYAEALGRCMAGLTGVCVAGTHGKSTTTAMLGCALAAAGLDPSVIVGATCRQLSGPGAGAGAAGFRLGAQTIPATAAAGGWPGQPGLLIAEACEFNRSFHNYRPRIAAITSVEADHLDVYGTLDAVVESFRHFASLLPPAAAGGALLIGHQDAHRREVASSLACAVETIGFSPEADWQVRFEPQARRVVLSRRGGTWDEAAAATGLTLPTGEIAEWTMKIPGAHNALNGGTAAALSILLGADPGRIARSLADFAGVDRRSQLLGERSLPRFGGGQRPGEGVRVYDDYGHHPTEVDATLRALREFDRPETRGGSVAGGTGGGRLICVFQPHQHSRTRFLLDEFAAAFSSADLVIVPDIYFVRDSEIERTKVSSADLVDRLRERGIQAMHLYPFEAIVEQLEVVCRPGDLVVVMGAGPVDRIGRAFLAAGPSTAPGR